MCVINLAASSISANTVKDTMKISIFGLGYVGCVSAACLANDGHQVTGVDVSQYKVDSIIAGKSPIIERGLDELIKKQIESGTLCATTDGQKAVLQSDSSLICVGTPSASNGSLNTGYVEKVCAEIGAALAKKSDYHVVVIRSTVLPTTVQNKLIPILEESSGLRAGEDFGVCMNPQSLREGSAIKDYYRPSYIVIGSIDKRAPRSWKRSMWRWTRQSSTQHCRPLKWSNMQAMPFMQSKSPSPMRSAT